MERRLALEKEIYPSKDRFEAFFSDTIKERNATKEDTALDLTGEMTIAEFMWYGPVKIFLRRGLEPIDDPASKAPAPVATTTQSSEEQRPDNQTPQNDPPLNVEEREVSDQLRAKDYLKVKWTSSIGDPNTLDVDEAYEVLCHIHFQRDREYVQTIGFARRLERNYRHRYLSRPDDHVVLGTAFIEGHSDLDPYDREKALQWLRCWDDATPSFRVLKRKGGNLASL